VLLFLSLSLGAKIRLVLLTCLFQFQLAIAAEGVTVIVTCSLLSLQCGAVCCSLVQCVASLCCGGSRTQ